MMLEEGYRAINAIGPPVSALVLGTFLHSAGLEITCMIEICNLMI